MIPHPRQDMNGVEMASPAVRNMIMRYNLKLGELKGTGRAGRVTKEDVLDHISKERNSLTSRPSNSMYV